jgi:hypothetical protein
MTPPRLDRCAMSDKWDRYIEDIELAGPQEAELTPSGFERFADYALGSSRFWSKQAVLQSGALLGNIALGAAAGLAAMKGHATTGHLLTVVIGVAIWKTMFLIRDMAEREKGWDMARGRVEGASARCFHRILAGGLISLSILTVATHAAPALSARAYKRLYGHAPSRQEMQQYSDFFK